MDKNKQFAIFVFVLFLLGVAGIKKGFYAEKESKEKKIKITKIESKNQIKDGKLDINLVDIKDITGNGISYSIAEKIVYYREKTGTINSFEELKNIKGIGNKKIKLIENLFCINNTGKKNVVNINDLSEEELLWYGLDKKEIKKIISWKYENGSINSNLDLIKILGETKYNKVKSQFYYQKYN